VSAPDVIVGVSIGVLLMLLAIGVRDWVNHMAWLNGYTHPRRLCEGCGELFETQMSDDELCWVVPPHGHPQHPKGCPGGGMPGRPA
jgi:hypothetical protein